MEIEILLSETKVSYDKGEAMLKFSGESGEQKFDLTVKLPTELVDDFKEALDISDFALNCILVLKKTKED